MCVLLSARSSAQWGLHLRTDGFSDSGFGNRTLLFFKGAVNAMLAVLSVGGKREA